MKRWQAVGSAVVTTLMLGVTACSGGDSSDNNSGGGGSSEAEPQQGGSVSLAFNTDTNSLDPAKCGTAQSWQFCAAIFGSLLVRNIEEEKFEPVMAESLETEDGLTWTLKLREGMTFTDGTPFDAEAVNFNWTRAKNPATGGVAARTLNAMTWSVVDPLTVEITLQKPNYQLPWSMETELAFIGSPTALQSMTPEDIGNKPVGAGPFKLDSWTRGTEMRLSKNDDYWDAPKPYLDEIVFKVIPPDDQRFNALNSGELDIMASLVAEYGEKAEDAGFVVESMPFFSGTGVRINYARGPMADPDVRLAVNKLIDAEQIVNAFYAGTPAPETFANPESPYYNEDKKYPDVDVAGAQKLIDKVLARTGEDAVRLTYRVTAGVPLQLQIGEMLQAQLQKVNGIQLEILPLEITQYLADVAAGNFDLFLSGILGVNPDALYQHFHTGASQNSAGYSNPEVDRLLDEARATDDVEEQTAAYTEVTGLLTETLAHRPWRYSQLHLAHPEEVHGVVPAVSYWARPELIWREQ